MRVSYATATLLGYLVGYWTRSISSKRPYTPCASTTTMAKKNEGPGIQSAAGLIRYFDADEKNNIKIPPSAVLVFSGVVGVGVILMKIFWTF